MYSAKEEGDNPFKPRASISFKMSFVFSIFFGTVESVGILTFRLLIETLCKGGEKYSN